MKFFLCLLLSLSWLQAEASPYRDPNYQAWLDSHDGTKNPFRYNLATFPGNRQENRQNPHELASPHERPVPSSLVGNFRLEIAPVDVRGLNQTLLIPAAGSARGFEPRGQEIKISKRFSRPEDRLNFRLEATLMNASDSFSLQGGNTIRDGRVLNNPQGNLDFDQENLRLEWAWHPTENLQSRLGTLAGFSLRRMSADSHIADTTQFADWKLSQWGIIPYIGLEGETPLSRSVHLYGRARLGYAFTKSEVRRDTGQAPATTQTIRRKRDFIESDISAGFSWFWDRTHRLSAGWQYAHADFPNLDGPTGIPLEELSWSGPQLRLDFLF